jgi:hypothetical protein
MSSGIGIGTAVALAIGTFLYFERRRSTRLRVRVGGRVGLSKREFGEYFKERLVPDEVSNAVYDYFSAELGNQSVDPQDSLVDVYELDGNRLEEAFDVLSKHLPFGSVDLRAADSERRGSIHTVADLVLLINNAVHYHRTAERP